MKSGRIRYGSDGDGLFVFVWIYDLIGGDGDWHIFTVPNASLLGRARISDEERERILQFLRGEITATGEKI